MTQTTPVIQQVNVIQVSALLLTFIARAICSSRLPLFSGPGGVEVLIGMLNVSPPGSNWI